MYSLTAVTDSREHEGYRLPFPDFIKVHLRRSKTPTLIKIAREVDTMPAGDYTLKGFENVVLVETKRSAREVRENLLTPDFRRSSRAFDNLGMCRNPILACEFGQSELLCGEYGSPELVDHFAAAVARHNLRVWFCGPRSDVAARRRTAEVLLRLMIACVELECPNFLHGSLLNDENVPGKMDSGNEGVKRRRCRQPRGRHTRVQRHSRTRPRTRCRHH